MASSDEPLLRLDLRPMLGSPVSALARPPVQPMNVLPLPFAPFVGVLLALGACASTGKGTSMEELGAQPYDPSLLRPPPQSIGPYLAEINNGIAAWNNLILSARTPEDRRKVVLLEEDLTRRASLRFEDLVDQLQTGPRMNRSVAAAALGFSKSSEALSPLLVALEDDSDDVVSNALLGLGQLQHPDTPVSGIVAAMRFGEDARVRGNAARALRRLLEVGVEDPLMAATAREGLTDSSPVVRSQSALMLAHLVDSDAIELLRASLDDSVPLVAIASARALSYIGDHDDASRGACARALTGALDSAPPLVRERILGYLRELADKNLGKESKEWVTWAHGLP